MTVPLSKDQIQQLQDFNEIAETLINSSYVKESKEKKPAANLLWQKNKQTDKLDFSFTKYKVHDEDSTKSFLLTLRMIVQDNERTSIHNMSILYEAMPINQDYKNEFNNLRNVFNDFLDAPAITTVVEKDKSEPSRRDIFEAFMWGKYAHLNPKKRESLKRWQTYKVDWDMVANEFEFILNDFVDVVTLIKDLNERVLIRYS